MALGILDNIPNTNRETNLQTSTDNNYIIHTLLLLTINYNIYFTL